MIANKAMSHIRGDDAEEARFGLAEEDKIIKSFENLIFVQLLKK